MERGRFIILTGYSEFEYAKSAISLGVKEYLLKPIDENELMKNVRNIYEEIKDCEWTPDYIEFYVDGISTCRYNKTDDPEDQSEEAWPFDQPFYLIFNIAVDGSLGGEVDDTQLPFLLSQRLLDTNNLIARLGRKN